jgi:hypothetical protein
MNGYMYPAMLLPSLTKEKELLTDRGYDAGGFRMVFLKKCNTSCSELGRQVATQEKYAEENWERKRRFKYTKPLKTAYCKAFG